MGETATQTGSTERKFAYGYDEVGNCACPAVAAGFSPSSGEGTYIAEKYDDIIREDRIDHEGTVDEETAKEAWLEALEAVEDREGELRDVEIGKSVAEELDWQ